MANEARIDKWLWAARIFKTRSIAADACKNGRVTMKGQNMKPSHMVKVGEVVSVKKPPITYSFKILKPLNSVWAQSCCPKYMKTLPTPSSMNCLR